MNVITYHRTSDGEPMPEIDALDANGTLKPGFTMRTKVQMMDGVPDVFAKNIRNGYSSPATVRYEASLKDAWKNIDSFNGAPRSSGANKPKPGEGEEEDPDEEELKAKRDSAYAAYDARIANAWRT